MQLQQNRKAWFALIAIAAVSLILAVALIIALSVTAGRSNQQQENGEASWQKQPVSNSGRDIYKFNAVTADSAVCSTMADYIMNVRGGNAMDAAVTGLLCVGVSNLHSAGIGGGSFLVFYNRSAQLATSYNFREVAPINSSRSMYTKLIRNASLYGGLAVAVPGEVAGLVQAHGLHGRLPWQELVLPVVRLLQIGQRVTKPLGDAVAQAAGAIPDDAKFAELKQWLINPATNRPYATGDVLKDEKLAKTMQTIAYTPEAFYNGSLAEDIAQEIQEAGGIVSKQDLLNYQPRQVESLRVRLRNKKLDLHSLPPPSSGAVLGFILNIIDGYTSSSSDKSQLQSYATFLHRIVEAFKFGYAKRSALGDAEFVNVTQLLRDMKDGAFADEVRANITDDATHDVNFYGPSFDWAEDSGTSHLSVLDSEGNAVSVTSTINTRFGSLVRGRKTGIIYNNEMDDFSSPNRSNYFGVPPSPSNFIEPAKCPMSSMAPVILTDDSGDVKFISGASGGTRITTAVAYNLIRQMYLNETVKQAADAFRFHHQLVPNAIQFNPNEVQMPPEIRQELERKGHKFDTTTSFSVVNGIQRLQNGNLQANADFRKPSKTGGM